MFVMKIFILLELLLSSAEDDKIASREVAFVEEFNFFMFRKSVFVLICFQIIIFYASNAFPKSPEKNVEH